MTTSEPASSGVPSDALHGSSSAGDPIYRGMDEQFNLRSGAGTGFEALLGAQPYAMKAHVLDAFRSRYQVIKSFQEQALSLFKLSLQGACDPELAQMVVSGLPETFGTAYHRQLTDAQHRTPVFFRTDEVEPGQLSEVQCSGSGWDLVELMQYVYRQHPELYGQPVHFKRPLAEQVKGALERYLGAEPVIHHLVDNASRPHGMRYFIQCMREAGARYFSYDKNVHPTDCNFVRSHDFVSLAHHNFYAERMVGCDRGQLCFDLPPSALFDGKLILAWPFWHRTRDHFTDEVRSILPHTSVIEPDGMELEEGHVTLDQFLSRSAKQRAYYVKYAGTDISRNWGSRAVHLASTYTAGECRKLFDSIVNDWHRGHYWVIQPAIRCKESASVLTRDGNIQELNAYAKWSAFYGPDGLMSVCVYHKHYHKVHGSADTVMSIVY